MLKFVFVRSKIFEPIPKKASGDRAVTTLDVTNLASTGFLQEDVSCLCTLL